MDRISSKKALLAVLIFTMFLGCGSSSSTTDDTTTTDTLSGAPSGFSFTNADGTAITSVTRGTTAYLRDSASALILAFTTSGNVSLTNLVAGRNSTQCLAHFPSSSDKSGLTGTISLYTACTSSNDVVVVCPSAAALSEMSGACTGAVTLTASTPTSGNYTWSNPTGRTASADCIVSASVDNFGTGIFGSQSGSSQDPLSLTSADITSGGTIGSTYVYGTCMGSNTSPDLSWTNVPSNAASLAITMVDTDCTTSCSPDNTTPFVHWIIYNIPTSVLSLSRGASTPSGATLGPNNYSETGYGGPCPPMGQTHDYVFKVWSLSRADLTADTSISFSTPSSIYNGINSNSNGSASFGASYTSP